jgi:hypothetical protein
VGGGLALALAGSVLGAAPSQAAAQGVAGAAPSIFLALPPGAPTGIRAEITPHGALVSWTPPANNGGSPIVSYRVAAQPGEAVKNDIPASSTSAIVSGLANGVPYTFTVRADNIDGKGTVSAPSNTIMFGSTLSTVPGAPTNVVAAADVAAPGSATVSWTPPSSDGGAFITKYKVTAQPSGLEVEAGRDMTTATVTNLGGGISHTFVVKAINDVGASLASAPSNAVVLGGGPAAVPPDAPTNVAAVAGDRSATVTWTPPASDGGSPITSYRITGRGTDQEVTTGGSATSAVFTGLTNGVEHKFKVFARNGAGESVASLLSNPVIPGVDSGTATVPDVPTNVTATSASGAVIVSWTAPADGGSPITKYWISAQPGTSARQVDAPATSAVFTDLKRGTSYTFKVSAVNAVGRSLDSAASNTAQVVGGVGDFSGDGKADIIARKPNGDLILYTGNGTGGFTSPAAWKIGLGWQMFDRILSPGDFTGDGKSDIIARKPNGDLMLYAGNGGAGFSGSPKRIGAGWQVFDRLLSTGDWNGDGKSDIIARKPNGDLIFYAGNGLGGFAAAGKRIGAGWQVFDRLFSTGDFSGDGRTDILARKPNGDLILYTGNGLGGFSAAGKRIGLGWHTLDRMLSSGDYNGDGKSDIIARTPSGYLRLYTGNGAGSFTAPAYTTIGAGWQVFDILFGPGV